MVNANSSYSPGLEGVVAARTRLSSVDGQKGELIIGGFPLEELAPKAGFEETVFLLLNGRLPERKELIRFSADLASRRSLHPGILQLLQAAAGQRIGLMDALRMGTGALTLSGEGGAPLDEALDIIARLPTITAAYWRLLYGHPPVVPDKTLSHAQNYLYMLTGIKPGPAKTRGLETYLNTVIDHGLNASTFTARVIISTQADMVSAVTGALGALKGPLHGGAPGPALDMVFEIAKANKAEAYIRAKLERGERLMGFGHRVYRVRDPRAEVLGKAARRMYQAEGDMALYELARQVEKTAVALLAEYKPGRNLQTNVEFYTALLLHGLGLDSALFTPTFAVARAAGWTAHCLEQQAANRIIRPKSEYYGAKDRPWIPLEERSKVIPSLI